MRQLIGINKTSTLSGQRRASNDDFEVLQSHFHDGLQRMFVGYSPCVISGCAVSGNSGNYQISDGLVYINQKLVYFPGANNYDIKANTYIVETEPSFELPRLFDAVSEDRPGVVRFQCGLTESSFTGEGIKLSIAGAGRTYQSLLGDRIYLEQFERASNNIVLPGTIIMWAGSLLNFDDTGLGKNAMSAWALCNGKNGTPDMRGRFVVGYHESVADYDTLNKQAGEKEITLGLTQIPKHRHVPTPNEGEGGLILRSQTATTTTAAGTDSSGSGTQPNVEAAPVADKEMGGNAAHENRPPYHVVAYLMKIGAGSAVIVPPVDIPPVPPGCNLQQGQILGKQIAANTNVEALYHDGKWWLWNIHVATTPRRAYARGINLATWTGFLAAGTFPNLSCFAPYETGFDGREHPSQFNGSPTGWVRVTDEGGYVAFDEVLPGEGGSSSGSGGGDIDSNIIFEITVL